MVRRQRLELLRRLDDWLDLPFAILSLVWVILLVVELASLAQGTWSADVYRLDTFIWALFLGHFLLQLGLAPSKVGYLRSHWLTAISVALPLLRVIRFLRVIRLLRTLSLARVLLTANRVTRSASAVLSRHRFGYVATVVALLALLAAGGVSYFEQDAADSPLRNFGQALWWSLTMVTTINSSSEPVTIEGRVIAFLLRIVGLALFSYVAGSVASYFVGQSAGASEDDKRETVRELRRMAAELAHLRSILSAQHAAAVPMGNARQGKSIGQESTDRHPLAAADGEAGVSSESAA